MKKIKFFTIYIILLFTFSCEDDNNIGIDTVSITIEDLYAPQEGSQGQSISGPFTKFNFEDGVQTESETNWDVGFRGTSIIVMTLSTQDNFSILDLSNCKLSIVSFSIKLETGE